MFFVNFFDCGKNNELHEKYNMSFEYITEVAREVIKKKETLVKVFRPRGQ